jgi:nitrile hydratase subunit beta
MSYRSNADLGGREDYGRIVPEPEGTTFHVPWEAQVLALTVAMGYTGAWNLDMSRSARETLPDYSTLSYYQIWYEGLLRLMAERGLISAEELASGRALKPARTLTRVLKGADVAAVLATGSPTVRPATAPALFTVGDRVRTVRTAALHHTRLPGYARGKQGIVERVHGVHVFADANSQGLGEQPQWLYTVTFDGSELWGEKDYQGLRVSIDAWEPYLEQIE